MNSSRILALLTFASISCSAFAETRSLVSDESIARQKSLTKTLRLSNGIPVVFRQVEGSDIFAVAIGFEGGQRDLPTGKKALNRWAFSSMPMAGEGYPRNKVHENTEKYSLAMSCSGGIEMSTCSLSGVGEYWAVGMPMFAAVVTKPTFADADTKLVKDRLVAQLKNVPQEPGDYVNEIVNKVYYPAGHPYRLNHDEALAELASLNRSDLVEFHKKSLNARLMKIVVASSLDEKKVMGDLERYFGKISGSEATKNVANDVPFDPANSYLFQDRDIPTAYIRAKFDAPGILKEDAIASRLMFEILSEELGDEIRTKRSLSYSVFAFGIQYSKGIGNIGASTSKPEETLSAMGDVINKLKTHTYSADDIKIYKTGFSTAYYMTQETHGSLAEALLNSLHYYGTTDALYDFPKELEKVTAADIKRLANQILVNLRIGVIYTKSKFKDEWAKNLIQSNATPVKR